MASISLWIFAALQLPGTTQSAPPADRAVIEDDEPRQIEPADWSLLMDKDGNPLGVRKLKLIMYEKKVPRNKGLIIVEPRTPCEIETTDEVLLAVMSFYLYLPSRNACPETPRYNYVLTDTTECLGELHVTTTRGQLMLGITPAGFALQAKEGTYRNTFESWGVAHVIDRILRDHGQQGLSPEQMLKLSPEGRSEVEKRHLQSQEELLRKRKQ